MSCACFPCRKVALYQSVADVWSVQLSKLFSKLLVRELIHSGSIFWLLNIPQNAPCSGSKMFRDMYPSSAPFFFSLNLVLRYPPNLLPLSSSTVWFTFAFFGMSQCFWGFFSCFFAYIWFKMHFFLCLWVLVGVGCGGLHVTGHSFFYNFLCFGSPFYFGLFFWSVSAHSYLLGHLNKSIPKAPLLFVHAVSISGHWYFWAELSVV